ncbi:MAG: GNAT family N-acetyltransferase [Pseudomonadota bacterium]
MKLDYREAQQKDLENLIVLLADDELGSTREDRSIPINPRYQNSFEEIDRDPNNRLIVAECDGELAGMMQLTFIPYLTHTGSWRCLIEGVRVARAFRGKGLGTQLIGWAINAAKKRQCGIVQLTSDKQRPDAIRFYETLGFKATHEGFKLKL